MLDLRLLGTPLLRRSPDELPLGEPPPRSKRFLLLAYLAMAGSQPRHWVLALFWPELDQRRGAAALRQTLYLLRREIGVDAIVSRGENLEVDDALLRCDAQSFQEAIREDRLEDALALYRGRPLEGSAMPQVDAELEHAVERERERYFRQAMEAAERLTERAAAGGDLREAIGWARRSLELDPADEAALQRLIQLLDAGGDRSGAVRAYESFAQHLADEVGVEPSAETQALLATIRERSESGEAPVLEIQRPASVGDTTPSADARRTAGRSSRVAAILVPVVLVLAMALFSMRPETAADPVPGAVVILPFTSRGPDTDVWREGMMDLLSANLDGAGDLRTIDTRTVLARWNERVAAGETANLRLALDVARGARARYALVGSAIALGSEVRLAADIYDVGTGRRVGRSQAAGSADSLAALVDRLSLETLRMILREGSDDLLPRVHLAGVTTPSLEALKAYLRGETRLRRSDFHGAIRHYEHAVAVDSTFALAFYRLGQAYGWQENIESGSGLEHLERAARLSSRLPRRQAVLAGPQLALMMETLDGIETLEQAVRRYPEDPEIWYLLGDSYVHMGPQALVVPGEADRALGRAVALDPGFTPAYIHLIENAFLRADSVRLSRLLPAYMRRAPDTRNALEYGLAFDLAYGDDGSRDRAFTVLDTLDIVVVENIALLFQHPRFLHLQGRVLELLVARPDASWETRHVAFHGFLRTGRFKDALLQLEDPTMPDEVRGEAAHRLLRSGLSSLPAWLEDDLRVPPPPGPPDWRTFFGGAYAVDRGQWDDHARALERFRGRAGELRAEGDSTVAALNEGAARGLEGYSLWRRGRAAEAIPLLEASRAATVLDPPVNEAIRWWLAEISRETGRDAAAERYYRSLWDSPLASLRLGEIHARRGERDMARLAYGYFLSAWRDADAELQPRLEKARRDLAGTGRS